MNYKQCPVCESLASAQQTYDPFGVFYACPVCGRFEITHSGVELQNNPKLQSFLFYNHFLDDNITEYRYHTTLSKEKCDEYKKDFEEGDTSHGHPVHMNSDIIENWYPKTFADRVDYILLYLSKRAKHIGQRVTMKGEELYGLLFIDRKELNEFTRKTEPRQDFVCQDEAGYM